MSERIPITTPNSKRYTFTAHCSFEIQYAFSRADVETDGDIVAPESFEPTEEALVALERELATALTGYSVGNIEAGHHEESDSHETDD